MMLAKAKKQRNRQVQKDMVQKVREMQRRNHGMMQLERKRQIYQCLFGCKIRLLSVGGQRPRLILS